MKSLAEKLKSNPPVKRYRIGEVARFSGLSRQTVHNYTIMGLITECQWTPGGHRLYHESVFTRLAYIDELKRTKTLRQICTIMRHWEKGPNSLSSDPASASESA